MSVSGASSRLQSRLDPKALEKLVDTVGAESMAEVLAAVLGATPESVAGLRAAIASADLPAVAHQAHKLKSDCAYLGATDIVTRLMQIESHARAGRSQEVLAAADDCLGQLDGFLEDVRHERRRWLG